MDPNLFFPKRGGGQRKAKKVCEDCTVKVECREYADRTNTHYGIWGGEVLKRWGDSSEADLADPPRGLADESVSDPAVNSVTVEPITFPQVPAPSALPIVPPD